MSVPGGQRVPLIPAPLDSDLVPGTSGYTVCVQLTCRWGTLKKDQWRREILNNELSKRVFQANKVGKVVLGWVGEG